MIYRCKPLFEKIKAQVAAEIDNFPLEDPPTVCIITTGEDEPSARYDDTGELHGDFEATSSHLVLYQTPVPGGMGLMGRAALILNILDAYKRRRGI